MPVPLADEDQFRPARLERFQAPAPGHKVEQVGPVGTSQEALGPIDCRREAVGYGFKLLPVQVAFRTVDEGVDFGLVGVGRGRSETVASGCRRTEQEVGIDLAPEGPEHLRVRVDLEKTGLHGF